VIAQIFIGNELCVKFPINVTTTSAKLRTNLCYYFTAIIWPAKLSRLGRPGPS